MFGRGSPQYIPVGPSLISSGAGRYPVISLILAASRGCIGASLDTYSFQARGFYEKRGYSLVGTIGDCPPGGARHFLQKRFERAA